MVFKGYINLYVDSIRMICLYVNEYNYGGICKKEKNFQEYERNMPKYMINCIGCVSHKLSIILLKMFSDDHNNKEWDIMSISDIDELYVPSIDVSSTNYVNEQKEQKIGFYDGPFFFLPYCHVYKCIVGVKGDDNIHSFFPNENKDFLIHKNEFVAFDYNRDSHYVYKTENNNDESDYTMVIEDGLCQEDTCIMLKIHYIIFPKFLPIFIVNIYKKLHIWIDTAKWVFKNL